jgi:hypothetical protein
MTTRHTMPDGHDSRSYDYTEGFSRGDWAWEFLRRDPLFTAAMVEFSKHVTAWPATPHVTVYELKRGAPSLQDWGLTFRRLAL